MCILLSQLISLNEWWGQIRTKIWCESILKCMSYWDLHFWWQCNKIEWLASDLVIQIQKKHCFMVWAGEVLRCYKQLMTTEVVREQWQADWAVQFHVQFGSIVYKLMQGISCWVAWRVGLVENHWAIYLTAQQTVYGGLTCLSAVRSTGRETAITILTLIIGTCKILPLTLNYMYLSCF